MRPVARGYVLRCAGNVQGRPDPVSAQRALGYPYSGRFLQPQSWEQYASTGRRAGVTIQAFVRRSWQQWFAQVQKRQRRVRPACAGR